MDAQAIRDDDADYSFLIKQCSSAINRRSSNVGFAAIRRTAAQRSGPRGLLAAAPANRPPV
jgi:hypothetical protein